MNANKQIKNNRLIFLSIIGIPVMVVLAATWLWFFVVRGDFDLVGMLGTSNHGQLVQPPRQLNLGNLLDEKGQAFSPDVLPAQWTFLVPGGSGCDSECERVLYLTRQIRLAMGKETHRIRRFYVTDTAITDTRFEQTTLSDKRPAPANFWQYMQAEQNGVTVYTISSQKRAELFPEYLADHSTWYLVDPAGWVMMSYNGEISYKQVMDDLKFLFKNSSE